MFFKLQGLNNSAATNDHARVYSFYLENTIRVDGPITLKRRPQAKDILSRISHIFRKNNFEIRHIVRNSMSRLALHLALGLIH